MDSKEVILVLEKMIDSQIANTEALTSLKATLDENNERLAHIEAFFSNGFRSDIKNIAREVSEVKKDIEDIVGGVSGVFEKSEHILKQTESAILKIESYKEWGFWVRTSLGLLTALAAAGGAIYGIIKIFQP